MLQSLSIRNVVLIDKLDLEFKSGLSVLTGETGAGKSILLDSLGLVLGNRAETALIRHGEEKLSVTAVFSIDPCHPVFELLREFELEIEDEMVIKRTLDRDGKGKIFLNDQPITAKLLKEIGRTLVEIHGQFDNQGLLNASTHREVLDNYGGYSSLLSAVKEMYLAYKKAHQERLSAEENLLKAKSDEENLRHWIDELEKAKLKENEEEFLSQRRLELMNAEKIIAGLNYAYTALTEGKDVVSSLRSAQSGIDKVNRLVEGKYNQIMEQLELNLINCSEVISAIEDASSNISHNQNELEEIDGRFFALKALARKHNCTINDLQNVLDCFGVQLAAIELGEDGIINLRKLEEEKRLDYLKTANALNEKRKIAAKELDAKVMQELPPLKMDRAKFVTKIEKLDENSFSEFGVDSVQFTVSTNPNSPQGAINKIASGGELARFMLALKVNLAATSDVATMIFDEVDSGIGGATAQAVGDRLAKLGDQVQVLVVTHSPQVASRGHHHFKVAKSTEKNITTTNVFELKGKDKEEEVARMLAGETISDEARAAAKVLISQ